MKGTLPWVYVPSLRTGLLYKEYNLGTISGRVPDCNSLEDSAFLGPGGAREGGTGQLLRLGMPTGKAPGRSLWQGDDDEGA